MSDRVSYQCSIFPLSFPLSHLDPFNWSVSDVQKWLLWMQRWVQLPSLKLEHFAMDGMSLCALTEEDFRQRVPHGEKLYAKLDIWRMAFNYFGATDFDSIFGEFQEDNNSNNSYGQQQQQQQQQQYCASPYSTSSSTDASSLYSGSSPISPEGYGVSNSGSGCGSLPTYAESMYGGGMCGNGSIASPASPASSSHSSVNSCSPYGQQQQNSYGYGQTLVAPQQQQQQQYGKASILSMNDFSNMTNTCAMITAVVNGGGAQPMQQQRMVATSDYGSDAIPSDGKFSSFTFYLFFLSSFFPLPLHFTFACLFFFFFFFLFVPLSALC